MSVWVSVSICLCVLSLYIRLCLFICAAYFILQGGGEAKGHLGPGGQGAAGLGFSLGILTAHP